MYVLRARKDTEFPTTVNVSFFAKIGTAMLVDRVITVHRAWKDTLSTMTNIVPCATRDMYSTAMANVSLNAMLISVTFVPLLILATFAMVIIDLSVTNAN
jgi:hypothetical protein